MKKIDIFQLNSVDSSMVSYSSKKEHPWNEIVSDNSPEWLNVRLIRQTFDEYEVNSEYAVSIKPVTQGVPTTQKWVDIRSLLWVPLELNFKIKVSRQYWDNLRGIKNVKRKKSKKGKKKAKREELPSYKNHKYFNKPEGKFHIPINKQASNLYKGGEQLR